jgi:hypothetical protein
MNLKCQKNLHDDKQIYGNITRWHTVILSTVYSSWQTLWHTVILSTVYSSWQTVWHTVLLSTVYSSWQTMTYSYVKYSIQLNLVVSTLNGPIIFTLK